MLPELRTQVWEGNVALPREGLVRGTSGNASGRDAATGLVAIKPSGMNFAAMTPDDLVIVDDTGTVVEGTLKPSVDTASHLYVYRHRDDVMGIVHTHSPYATSFAIRGEPLGIYTTTAACIFGGDIPITEMAVIGEEDIGEQIVAHAGNSPAVLVRHHGVFTFGDSPSSALRAAVYVEEEAEAIHLALLRGDIVALDDATIAAARAWYLADYGQAPRTGGA